MIKPWCSRNVHREFIRPLRIIAPVPDPAPGCPAVGAAENHFVRPPGIQAGYHNRIRILGIHSQTAETIPVVGSRGRADICPGSGCGIELPDLTFAAVIRANSITVGDVQTAR